MPKLKIEDEELDLKELEDAEFDEDKEAEFEPYDGPQPPKDTLLRGYIKKLWWTYSKKDDPMLVILFVAEGNTGSKAKYNGLPIWERIVLTSAVKFKWFPFLRSIGLTIADVKKKTVVAENADNQGDPIESIAGWEPGEDNDGAYVNVLTAREKFDGEWQTKAGKFLEWTDPEDSAAEAEEPDDEADLEPEEEEEEETPTPARGRTARAKGSAGSARATANASGNGKAATPSRSRAGRGAASSASRATKTAPARGRGRGSAKAKGEEPPF